MIRETQQQTKIKNRKAVFSRQDDPFGILRVVIYKLDASAADLGAADASSS